MTMVNAGAALRLALFCGASISSIASAQTLSSAPTNSSIDDHFIDLARGTIETPIKSISIGDPTSGGLTFDHNYGLPSSIEGLITSNGSRYTVTIDGLGKDFTLSGGVFTPVQADGTSLVLQGGTFTFRAADGTYATFEPGYSQGSFQTTTGGPNPQPVNPPTDRAGITYLQQPSGAWRRYFWATANVVPAQYAPNFRVVRLQSVQTSAGYQAQFSYQALPAGRDPYNGQTFWMHRTRVTLINQRLDNCPTLNNGCEIADRPFISFSALDDGSPPATRSVNDASGGLTTVTASDSSVTIQPPGNAPALNYALSAGKVTSATVAGVTVSYAYSGSTTTRTSIAGTETYSFDPNTYQLLSATDEINDTTSYTYNASKQLTAMKLHSGTANEIRTEYTPDSRGNVSQVKTYPKAGSPLPPITTSAVYAATCTNAVTCNLPISTTDAGHHVTAYDYDTASGLVTKVSQTAVGSVSPETRFSYSQIGGVARLTSVSACRSGAAPGCVGTSDETRTTIAYGTLAENNYLPKSVTTSSGDGGLTSVTAVTYNAMGDIATVDGPLAGTADTTQLHYDLALRRRTGVVAPDPDGTGVLKQRALHYSYDAAGRITKTEVGTVDGPSDAQWAAFSPLQAVQTSYDPNGRVMRRESSSGSTIYNVTQYSYDSLGRAQCTALRMNSASWSSQADACQAAASGADGPDRITRVTAYDALGYATEVTSAYGTPDAAVEKATFTAMGAQSVTDANSNTTVYDYDGFGRLSTTTYPGGSYEQLGYDSTTGNLTSRRLRDGQTISYGYDALNRMSNNSPAGARSVAYGYDLLGNLTEAAYDNLGGPDAVTMRYNALGQMTSSTTSMAGSAQRTLGYSYDAAGNRTQIVHPDGVLFGMSYDVLGEMKNASWTAAGTTVPFMAITLGDLGLRREINRGASYTGYNYDGASRLLNQDQRFAGGAGNTSVTFGYNPARQITSRAQSNDDYAWTGAVSLSRNYAVNALNEYMSAGPATFAYDGRGNLTSDGTNSFGYDLHNRMTSASTSGGTTLTYDPLGRLWQISSPATGKTQFLYDGDHAVAEYDGNTGAMRRRFFWGPGADEPVLWDEGSAMNCSGTHFLHTDERGSVIATANCGGQRQQVNSYDEYGIPGSNNIGRYQYTGQAWLSELGLYYYKARLYSPTLGRFLQTDPIGYADGMNWYNYVGGDPVNATDPSGLATSLVCVPVQDFWMPAPVPRHPGDIEVNGQHIPTYHQECRPVWQDSPSGFAPPVSPVSSQATGASSPALPQIQQRNGQKPPSHDDDDPDYNRDLNKCRALSDSGNKVAAEQCYRNAETRRRLRDNDVREQDLPPLVNFMAAAAGGLTAGVFLYWVISEGLRVVFPLRNLVPIP